MTVQVGGMTSAEARDILWDFSKTFLDGLTGAYYKKLREAIKVLYNESLKNENLLEGSEEGFDNYG